MLITTGKNFQTISLFFYSFLTTLLDTRLRKNNMDQKERHKWAQSLMRGTYLRDLKLNIVK